MAERKTKKKESAPRKRRKPAGESLRLKPGELSGGPLPPAVAELENGIRSDGGHVLVSYREPFGGHWVVLAALPIEQVGPTPYQRNLSDSHVRKLESSIARLARFLDPIIAVREPSAGNPIRYWTPNGHHRLAAMRTLGAASVTALVVPETSLAYRILALNTEKAHNLRERALEVIKMYQELAGIDGRTENDYALEFEEAALITLGICYAERPRFGGGAYHPIIKRCDQFLDRPLADTLPVRRQRAAQIMQLDDMVNEKVELLKARGLTSPYLRTFVVARINPLRFRPKDAAPLDFDAALERMIRAAAKLNLDRVKPEDLARSAGTAED